MSGPLSGVTVIALEQAVSAPLCTRHLADLGARVIKVENPGVGDTSRHYDGLVRGMSAYFVWLNYGKESAALNLTDAEDMALFREMVARADVLVSNLAPGALGRLGLAPADLVERHPRLIVVDISGYGVGGPIDHRRAYDLLVQAEGGSCAMTGWPGHPAKSGIPIADVGAALYGYSAVLAALYERDRTGRGAIIPVAMLDVVAELMGFALNQAIHGGSDPQPVGMGSPMVAPYGAYQTCDEQTVVLGTTSDREWARLATLIGRAELIEDPRYARNDDRVARRHELDEVVGAWCRTRSLAEIQRLADEAGIGNARYNGVGELAEHPQLTTRNRWRQVDTPAGPVQALTPPGLAVGWPVRRGSVPALGADTDAIRAEFGANPAGDAGPAPAAPEPSAADVVDH